jgi:hypothetical protein
VIGFSSIPANHRGQTDAAKASLAVAPSAWVSWGMEILGVAAITIVWILPIAFWMAADAKSRGRPGLIIPIAVALTPPVGLIAWLLMRPPKLPPDMP